MQYNNWIKKLIEKYLSGSASPEERVFLDEYYDSFDRLPDQLKENSDSEYRLIEDRMASQIQKVRIAAQIKNKQNRRWRQSVAAIFILLIGAGLWFFNPQQEVEEGRIDLATFHFQLIESQDTSKQVILPDGSIVILSPHSQLKYPLAFAENTRTVELIGAAYFDIVRDTQRMFIVQSENIETKVLGTAFFVRSMPMEDEIKVTVNRGKVAVTHDQETLSTLEANQQVSFNKVTGQHQESRVELNQDATLSLPEEYVLENMTLLEIGQFIEKRWGYEMTIETESLRNAVVFATFSESDSLEEFLFVLTTVLHAEYSIDQKKITVYEKPKLNK